MVVITRWSQGGVPLYFTGRLSKGTLDLGSGPKLFWGVVYFGFRFRVSVSVSVGEGGRGGGLTLDIDEMSRRKNFTLFVVQQA